MYCKDLALNVLQIVRLLYIVVSNVFMPVAVHPLVKYNFTHQALPQDVLKGFCSNQ